MSGDILTTRALIASLKDTKKNSGGEIALMLEGCDGCWDYACSVTTTKREGSKKVFLKRGREDDKSLTVNKTLRALSDAKKLGYADAEIIVEGCDCSGDGGSIETLNNGDLIIKRAAESHTVFSGDEDDNYF